MLEAVAPFIPTDCRVYILKLHEWLHHHRICYNIHKGRPEHPNREGTMSEPKDGCVTPAQGPILAASPQADQPEQTGDYKTMITARVGHPAPDFEASAYLDGGFRNIKLSDYLGRWVVLCFYPGDFTFV